MHRIQLVLFIALATAIGTQSCGAGETRSARQRFVVRIRPKVSFEAAGEASSTNERGTASGEVEAAFRLSGTGAAGITARVEIQPSSKIANEGVSPEVSLRVVDDEKKVWTATSPSASEEHLLQATSNGMGQATLIISSGTNSDGTVIITTIISND